MEIKDLYDIFLQCGAVTTDSRKISGGELFFALTGENFDGNEYATKALEAGAAYAVVKSGSAVCADADKYLDANGMSRIIPVEDTLVTLQSLARHHRENVRAERLPVIGITGTNGKTTTKELIRTVLAAEYKVAATEGNLNNDIGVPLSLLKITPDTQVAIIEMGASHPDDIRKLVKVCEPDYGIITNVGKAHLLGFGSFDGVKRAKGALYDYIASSGKDVFVNEDDVVLRGMVSERPGLSIVPYGLETEGASVLPCFPEYPYLRIRLNDGKVVETKLIGSYNAPNVMAALSIGRFFGVPEEKALAALALYAPSNSRSQMVKTDRNVVIADAYNANPSSMAAALKNFSKMTAPRKAVLLGDMRELGEDSVKEHVAVVRSLLDMSLDRVCLVGEEFRKALQTVGAEFTGSVAGSKGELPECHFPSMSGQKLPGIYWFSDSEALAAFLKERASDFTGFTILLKGSRGIRMETALSAL